MIYLNLSNGVEALPTIGPDARFCRIRSTTIERADWVGLLLECDADMLLRLALGECCCVLDYGTRRVMSKTVSVGIPVIRDVLETAWMGSAPTTTRGKEAVDKIIVRADTIDAQRARHHVTYYRRYLACDEVRLIGASSPTLNDGDREYQRDTLSAWMRRRGGDV